jgi:DNA adenine methylase
MSQFNENVRRILAHLKGVKGWSMKDVSDQAFFFCVQDRERFYKWLRRVKCGESVSRHHQATVKFERALRWMIHSNESLFEDEHLDFTLQRFDVIEWVLRLVERSDLDKMMRGLGLDAGLNERLASNIAFNAELMGETPRKPLRASKSVMRQPYTTEPKVVVKWTGSKRRQAAEILRHFPRQIETYFEPFLGGASLLLGLLLSDIPVKRVRCSDINPALIGIWNIIKDDSDALCKFYEHFWIELQRRGKEFYYEVRTRFNEDHDPLKFFALMRTCRNGYVRFNKDAEFNTGFHHRRRGINPKWLRPLLGDWSTRLNAVDVQFEVKDYRAVESTPGDFMYLDPPYKSRRGDSYGVQFNLTELWGWLEGQRGGYALSLNGFKDDEDVRVDVPRHLYDESFLIDNGTNAFHRMMNRKVIARDSLYVRLMPSVEASHDAVEPPPPLLIATDATPVATEANPALMPPNEKIDRELVERIREWVHTAKFETRDTREVLLNDLLTGRKWNRTTGRAMPKLNDPTAKYFAGKWRNAVIKGIEAGLTLADAIDAALNDWLATQK